MVLQVTFGSYSTGGVTTAPSITAFTYSHAYYRFSADTLFAHLDPSIEREVWGTREFSHVGTMALFSRDPEEQFTYDLDIFDYVGTVVEKSDNMIVIRYDDEGIADEEMAITYERGIGITCIEAISAGSVLELVSHELK